MQKANNLENCLSQAGHLRGELTASGNDVALGGNGEPHDTQKTLVALARAPHREHVLAADMGGVGADGDIGLPHEVQNLLAAFTTVPHREHFPEAGIGIGDEDEPETDVQVCKMQPPASEKQSS